MLPIMWSVLSFLGYQLLGSRNKLKPSIDFWNVSGYIENDKRQCLFNFLKSKMEQQSITDFNDNMASFETTCIHERLNLNQLSKFDEILIGNECDNIREFKINLENNLPIYKIEWIFKVHSFLEKFYF
jgi:hypothetical protein